MRSSVNQKTKELALLLQAYEAESGDNAVGRVCDKLRIHLSLLVGVVGFRTLLHRALLLSRAEVSCFDGITIGEEGTLQGLEVCSIQSTPKQLNEGGTILVGRLLSLLETFIGDALTLHLLQDIWPKLNPK